MFGRARRSPIGVEIGRHAVRMLQVEWTRDGGRVLASAEVKRDAGPGGARIVEEECAAAVRRSLKDGGFKGNLAVVALPSQETILRHVKVDVGEGAALHDALLFELEDAFPGDAPVVQHLEVGEVIERGEKRQELILLAAGLQKVEELLGGLEEAGLETVALDAETCALIRCFMRRRRRETDAETHTAIVHLGEDATLMAITGAGHALFMKQLPLGARQMTDVLEQRLDLTEEDVRYAGQSEEASEELAPRVLSALRLQLDSLILELSACLRYHAASRRSPGGLEFVLSGRGASIPGLADALSDALAMSVQRPDPFTLAFSGIESTERLARDYAAWSVPLGLTLRTVPA